MFIFLVSPVGSKDLEIQKTIFYSRNCTVFATATSGNAAPVSTYDEGKLVVDIAFIYIILSSSSTHNEFFSAFFYFHSLKGDIAPR